MFGDREDGRREGEETAEIIIRPKGLVRILFQDKNPGPVLIVTEEDIVVLVGERLGAAVRVALGALAPSMCTQCATGKYISLVSPPESSCPLRNLDAPELAPGGLGSRSRGAQMMWAEEFQVLVGGGGDRKCRRCLVVAVPNEIVIFPESRMAIPRILLVIRSSIVPIAGILTAFRKVCEILRFF
jgi:hypothetical protein